MASNNMKKRWQPTGFGDRLAAIRDSRGLTQEVLARLADVSTSTIHKLEKNRQEPAWPLVLALGRALGVDVGAFVPDPPAKPADPSPSETETETAEDLDAFYERHAAAQIQRRFGKDD